MDGLSATASVATLIQISGQVFDLCRTYYVEVKEARKDIQCLRDEMTSLQDVLISVADLADASSSTNFTILNRLNRVDGPVQKCRAQLTELLAKLEPGEGKNKMKQFGLRAMKWPFSSKEVRKTVVAIGRHRETFALALAKDHV